MTKTQTQVMALDTNKSDSTALGIRIFPGLLMVGLLTIFFYILAGKVVLHNIYIFDDSMTQFIRQFTNPKLTAIMKVITFLGSVEMQTLIAVGALTVLFLLRRPLTEKMFLAATITGSSLLTGLLKYIFQRPRPEVNQLIHETGYSFPSGHATVGIAFFGAIAYLLWTYLPPKTVRLLMAAGFSLVILAIGVSRVYLGVHYPSDILGGFAAGGAWLTVCVVLKQFLEYRNPKTPTGLIEKY